MDMEEEVIKSVARPRSLKTRLSQETGAVFLGCAVVLTVLDSLR